MFLKKKLNLLSDIALFISVINRHICHIPQALKQTNGNKEKKWKSVYSISLRRQDVFHFISSGFVSFFRVYPRPWQLTLLPTEIHHKNKRLHEPPIQTAKKTTFLSTFNNPLSDRWYCFLYLLSRKSSYYIQSLAIRKKLYHFMTWGWKELSV